MSGASIETTLELWASSLRDVKARMRGLFLQERVAASAGLFLDGLLGDERRKTGWMRAEAAGDPGPWRQQGILGRTPWDADALRDIVRDYVTETLGADDAVLVIDETGFLKQGKASCGVSRQYTGSAGKITNCQIGVFAAYVSARGHAFIDRALYLPKGWTDDRARMARCHVPADKTFATKPALAVQMIERAIAADVPFAWVAADSVYGVGDIEQVLRRTGKACPERLPWQAVEGVMCSGSNRTITSAPGPTSPLLLVVPTKSRKSLTLLLGNACRRARERKAQGCTTGPTSNSPTSMPQNIMRRDQACGRAGS